MKGGQVLGQVAYHGQGGPVIERTGHLWLIGEPMPVKWESSEEIWNFYSDLWGLMLGLQKIVPQRVSDQQYLWDVVGLGTSWVQPRPTDSVVESCELCCGKVPQRTWILESCKNIILVYWKNYFLVTKLLVVLQEILETCSLVNKFSVYLRISLIALENCSLIFLALISGQKSRMLY